MQKGQEVRTVIDYRPRRFTIADVLYDEDDRELHTRNGIARDANRWNELLIVRTEKGAIALRAAYRTRWQGEHGSETWLLAADEAGAAGLLAAAAVSRDLDDQAGGVTSVSAYLAKHALKTLDWWDGVSEEV